MDPAATPLTAALRAAVRAFYKGECQYCAADGASVVEHIVPRSRGGTDTLGNVTLACRRCNERKRSLLFDDLFLAIALARAAAVAAVLAALPVPKPAKPRPWWMPPDLPQIPGYSPRLCGKLYKMHGPEYVAAAAEIAAKQKADGRYKPGQIGLSRMTNGERKRLLRLAYWRGKGTPRQYGSPAEAGRAGRGYPGGVQDAEARPGCTEPA